MNDEMPVLLVALRLNPFPVDSSPKQGRGRGGTRKDKKEKDAYDRDSGKDNQTLKHATVSQKPVQLLDITLYPGSNQNLGYPM